MTLWRTADSNTFTHDTPAVEPHVRFVFLLIAAAFVGLVWLTPLPLLLPALSLLSITMAAVLACVAWVVRARRVTRRVNLWDIAGACALIGFAAGAISQPEPALRLFGVGG